jgi:hypothetical protein
VCCYILCVNGLGEVEAMCYGGGCVSVDDDRFVVYVVLDL